MNPAQCICLYLHIKHFLLFYVCIIFVLAGEAFGQFYAAPGQGDDGDMSGRKPVGLVEVMGIIPAHPCV
jgi:hypothetical protein